MKIKVVSNNVEQIISLERAAFVPGLLTAVDVMMRKKTGKMTLANGWTVSKDYGHLAHGYVVTSHASQGKTVDRVFIGQSSDSLPASSREQFYVSVSRGREQATIYTDDKEALLEAVSRSDDRLTATEFVAGRDLRERATTLQRLEQLAAIHDAGRATHLEQERLIHER